MNKPSHRLPKPYLRRGQQQGVALVVALVFLLALTIIGIATLSTTTVESRMAYGFNDYNRAFQAAESGIAEGERWLDIQPIKPVSGTGCAASGVSLCLAWAAEPAGQITDWFSFPWSTKARTYGFEYSEGAEPAPFDNHQLKRVSAQPTYVVEDIGKDLGGSLVVGTGPTYSRYYYRVTAQGTGAKDTTKSVVQSVYVVGY